MGHQRNDCRLSYLGKAVKWGNLNTFHALLEAGACPTKALLYLRRFPDSLPPCESPSSREKMILMLAERANPQAIEGSDESLVSMLLRTDEVRRYSPAAADGLIKRFFLDREDVISSPAPELRNSYILIAIILDLHHLLQYLDNRGFHVHRNEKIKKVLAGPGTVVIKSDVVGEYTWLSCAVHFGRPECVRFFLQSEGASSSRNSLSAADQFSLSMAQDNAAGPHPRATTDVHIWPYQPPRRVVPAEDDTAVLEVFRLAEGDVRGGVVTSPPSTHRKSRENNTLQSTTLIHLRGKPIFC